jgi:hypothetical protein
VIRGRTSTIQRSNLFLWLGLLATIIVIGLLRYFARRELARQLRS